MPKIAIVGLSLFSVLALLLLLTLPKGGTVQQFVRPNNDPPGNTQLNRVGGEVDRDFLQQIKSQLSSIEARLQVLEQRPTTLPPGLPSQFRPTLPAVPPMQLPDGSDAPWAWIERLDPIKQAAVEKAFNDAAALRAGVPEETGLDDPKLEASMAKLEQDVSRRLKSILSPQEFEAYLWSLPDDALERLGYEKSGN